jgi:putative spermidine/putrescine transport system ATP-binding protein
MVTHDQQEAMAMADRLVVMRDGRVQQVGAQEDLYERPATPFVARFIGNSNILAGRHDGAVFRTESGTSVDLAERYGRAGSATLALRPERIVLAEHGQVRGTVLLSSYMGATVEHVVSLDGQTQLLVRGPSSGPGATPRLAAGEMVSLTWPAASECLFDDADHPIPLSERITSHA